MKTLDVKQYVRPIKIGFLVNGHSYLDAVRMNTALWGGILNPLIPVSLNTTSGKKSEILGLLAEFDVDIILNMTKYKYAYIEDIYKNTGLRKTIYSTEDIFGPNLRGDGVRLNAGVSVVPVFRDILDKRKISNKPSRYLLIKNESLPLWQPMLSVVFGEYPKESPLDLASGYEQVMKPRVVNLSKETIDKDKLYEHPGPVHLTNYGLKKFRRGGWGGISSHLIYLGRLRAWRDLVEFWNLRAAGKEVAYIPYEFYEEFSSMATRFVEAGAYPINQNVQNSTELLVGSSVTESERDEVSKWLRERGNGIRSGRVPSWPYVSVSSWQTDDKEEDVIYDEQRIAPFRLTTPSMLVNDRGMGLNKWVTVLNLSSFHDDKYCFSYPVNSGVEMLAQSSFLVSDLRLSREGVVIYRDSYRERVHLQLTETARVVGAIFGAAGLDISISQPGRITQNLIDFLGSIRHCRLLKVDGIRKTLRRINKDGPLSVEEMMDEIKNNWHSDSNSDLVLESGGLGKKTTCHMALNALVRSKLIRPGLGFRCNQCGVEDWYSAAEFDDKYRCHFCFLEQDVPRLDQLCWKYATNGPIRIKDEGYGSLPVILSLWLLDHFSGRSVRSNGKWLASFDVKYGSEECEIDYIYLDIKGENKHDLLLGEAKGYGDITDKEVKKMKHVAKRLGHQPYLAPYLAFSTLKDEFSQSEKKLIGGLVAEGFRAIALTRNELDPYDLHDRFEGLANKYVFSLEELADNTQQLNL